MRTIIVRKMKAALYQGFVPENSNSLGKP
jgi:hypothetical protein